MKNIAISFTIFALALFAPLLAAAQIQQFGQPLVFSTTSTNSPLLVAVPFVAPMPAIQVTFTATNPAAIITNDYISSMTNGTTVTQMQRRFIYSYATYGTPFTTNFPAFGLPMTNYIYGQAAQVAGNTNGATIQ